MTQNMVTIIKRHYQKVPSRSYRYDDTMSVCVIQALCKWSIPILRSRQNGHNCRFADYVFKCLFFNEDLWISSYMPLKYVPFGFIDNISALVQIMVLRRLDYKPLSEQMMAWSICVICVTQPQWLNMIMIKITLLKVINERNTHYIYLWQTNAICLTIT